MQHLTYRLSLKFILAGFGLFLIGSVPALFDGIHLNIPSYLSSLSNVVANMAQPWSLTYIDNGVGRALLPRLLEPWQNTMTLFFVSFTCAFLLALAAACVTAMLPEKLVKPVKFIVFMLESLPDVLIMALFIFGTIWVYQTTGFDLFNVASYGEDEAFALPMMALTVIPCLMLYRTMVLDFDVEKEQPYVELAKGKGLKKHHVVLSHIFRNAFIRIFIDSKYVLWVMLSNVLIAEYIFNVNGLINFMLERLTPTILTVGCLMLFLPIFLFLAIGQVVIEKTTAERVEI
ncbi:ABC transporter permease subunit [Tuberibacillus sp. Marseille-P3662]|uniref:ABC transporter permease subunit n=1 Tax=Tuberibacillus sp. Marseille-P3662 TaxID=1965358 RepID=UPI000A1CA95D|nr:ABC transporter permease subunit [Tuberibacillus sp. Marseille-P3662]